MSRNVSNIDKQRKKRETPETSKYRRKYQLNIENTKKTTKKRMKTNSNNERQ